MCDIEDNRTGYTRMTVLASILMVSVMLGGCGSGSATSDDQGATPEQGEEPVQITEPVPVTDDIYTPSLMVSWQWQLQGDIDTSYTVEIYDIDLFDTPTATIEQLQAAGKRVICYFSAGSYEEWRSDATDFESAALGQTLDGWPGERWLDIRTDNVRQIMATRLDLAVEKGCDGVEPDNMDGYQNDPGFPLTGADQILFNRYIANAAHTRGLSVGLKNDLDQVEELVDYFDFAVNEQCFEYDECDLLQPFIDDGKPVLNAEYGQEYVDDAASRQGMCTDSVNRMFSTLVLPEDLDDSLRYSCL